jgi:hypothetical protein
MDDAFAEVENSYREAEEIDSLWNLAEDFSITNAASLVAGYNPVMVERCMRDRLFEYGFFRYPIAFKALTHAITNGRLKASLRYSAREYGYADLREDLDQNEGGYETGYGRTAEENEILSNDHSCFYKQFPDWSLSSIARDDIMGWLRSRGIQDGFFFQAATNTSDTPDFLDPKNSRYAAKLAAAVHAWQAVTDPGKRTPRQALEKWLKENAAKFGMTDDEGNFVKQAIEDCSKIANWQPGGGAPKTL